MPQTPPSSHNITSEFRRAGTRFHHASNWRLHAAIAGLGILACVGLLGWIARAAWTENRRAISTQLQSALANRSAAIDSWCGNRLAVLTSLVRPFSQSGDLQLNHEALLRQNGFAGYAMVGRDGEILSGDAQTIEALKREGKLKDVAQQALSGSVATSSVEMQAISNTVTPFIAFAVPIRPSLSPDQKANLALPQAAVVAWVLASEEFLPTIAEAKFGLSGRVYMPLDESVRSADSGIVWSGLKNGAGRPMVRAFATTLDGRIPLYAEMDAGEANAGFRSFLSPILVLLSLLVLCTVLLIWRVWHLIWIAKKQMELVMDGSQIGQYAIEERLGEGGMGVVYRARHKLMRRPAAIKLLDKGRSDATCIARFEREVQLTALLSHPNTISIYDYGLTDSGVFYYAMEYIDGVSLDTLVADGPLSEGRAIHLLAQLCGSLHEAHQVGLIHRDIKPANVLVTERGGLYDFVKLLDFGLVKAVQAKAVHITSDGASVGTPLFMSPEAIESPEDVDARSDLYSVGAIGYYLLTGKFVFVGKSSTEVCLKHLRERPTPMSMRGPNPISPDLEHLILQCLEKDRDNRPPTAFDLQQSLLACGEAFTWTEDEAAQWWSERKDTDRTKEFAEAASQSAITSGHWSVL